MNAQVDIIELDHINCDNYNTLKEACSIYIFRYVTQARIVQ